MITIEQSDAAIRETFYNMEEGAEYVFNDFWFAETNRLRKEYKCSLLKDKWLTKFSRKGDQLFVKNNLAFDFTGKSNLTFTFALARELSIPVIALPLALALQYNGFEKRKSDDGKVVEIDGKKYKLIAV